MSAPKVYTLWVNAVSYHSLCLCLLEKLKGLIESDRAGPGTRVNTGVELSNRGSLYRTVQL
jgi:hypothetical protein